MFRPRLIAPALAFAFAACAEPFNVTALAEHDASAASRLDATEYEIVDLGTFNGLPTQALDIDKHGAVYGLYGSGPSGRSFRWTRKEGYQDLGDFEGNTFRFLTA